MRGVSDPRISPDGERVAYVVERPDLEEDETDSDIWMTSWDGKETVRLTTSEDSESTPRWSPDGRFLAFLSDRGDEIRSHAALAAAARRRRGGEADRVPGVGGGLRLVPGRQAARPGGGGSGSRRRRRTRSPRPAGKRRRGRSSSTDSSSSSTKQGYLGTQRRHLVLLDRETRKTEALTTGEYDELLPAWSPDGKGIAFSSKRGARPGSHRQLGPLSSSSRAPAPSPRAVTTFEGADNAPEWEVARRGAPTAGGSPTSRGARQAHLLRAPQARRRPGGGRRRARPDGRARPQRRSLRGSWTAAPRSCSPSRTTRRSTSRRCPPRAARSERIVTGRRVVPAFSAAANGRIAILSGTAVSPNEVFAAGAGEPRRSVPPERRVARGGPPRRRRGDPLLEQGRNRDPTVSWSSRPTTRPGRRYPGDPPDPRRAGRSVRERLRRGVALVRRPRLRRDRGRTPGAAPGAGRSSRPPSTPTGATGTREDVLAAVDDAVKRGIADPDRLGGRRLELRGDADQLRHRLDHAVPGGGERRRDLEHLHRLRHRPVRARVRAGAGAAMEEPGGLAQGVVSLLPRRSHPRRRRSSCAARTTSTCR